MLSVYNLFFAVYKIVIVGKMLKNLPEIIMHELDVEILINLSKPKYRRFAKS